jgi:hypothetical protein
MCHIGERGGGGGGGGGGMYILYLRDNKKKKIPLLISTQIATHKLHSDP